MPEFELKMEDYTGGEFKTEVPVPVTNKDKDKQLNKELKAKDRIIRHKDKMLKELSPKKYDLIKDPGKLIDVTKWIRRAKNRIFPDRTYLINMELRNGMHKTFMITCTQDKFHFMGGRYIIDDEMKYYNITASCYALDYHQDFCMPVRRKIEPNKLKTAMKDTQPDEMKIDSATNPSTLDRFIESEMAKKVMEGQELAAMLKKLFAVGIISMIAIIVHLLMFMKKTGMLDSVSVPGM